MSQRGECIVCTEDDQVLVRVSNSCAHANNVCLGCVHKHAHETLHVKNTSHFTCPSCRAKVADDNDLRRLLPKSDYSQLDDILLREYLRSQPNFSWCLTPGCGNGHLHEGGDANNLVRCQGCRKARCFSCRVPFHDGMTCAEYRALPSTDDTATDMFVRQNCKSCPNCSVNVIKDDGCDHMICRKPAGCGHEYCWLCLADFAPIRKDGNHHHRTTCLHYRAIEPPVNHQFV